MSPEQTPNDGSDSQNKSGGFYRGLRKLLGKGQPEPEREMDPTKLAESLGKDQDYWIEPHEHDTPLTPEKYAAIQDSIIELLQRHPDTEPPSKMSPGINSLDLKGLNSGDVYIQETTLAARADGYHWIAQISGGNEERGHHHYVFRADGTIDEQSHGGDSDSFDRRVYNILLTDEEVDSLAAWLKDVRDEVSASFVLPGENEYKDD